MAASLRSLQIRQTLILIVLTIIYLCFELGFNARLLDVVGGDVKPHDVEDVEFYGRSLSGIAAALVVLQLMWRRRLKNGGKDGSGPSWKKILLWCTFTAVLVFMVLKTFVTVLVNTRDAEFRRELATPPAVPAGNGDDGGVLRVADVAEQTGGDPAGSEDAPAHGTGVRHESSSLQESRSSMDSSSASSFSL